MTSPALVPLAIAQGAHHVHRVKRYHLGFEESQLLLDAVRIIF